MNQLTDDEMDAMREAGLAVEDMKRMEQMEARRKESEAKMKSQVRIELRTDAPHHTIYAHLIHLVHLVNYKPRVQTRAEPDETN